MSRQVSIVALTLVLLATSAAAAKHKLEGLSSHPSHHHVDNVEEEERRLRAAGFDVDEDSTAQDEEADDDAGQVEAEGQTSVTSSDSGRQQLEALRALVKGAGRHAAKDATAVKEKAAVRSGSGCTDPEMSVDEDGEPCVVVDDDASDSDSGSGSGSDDDTEEQAVDEQEDDQEEEGEEESGAADDDDGPSFEDLVNRNWPQWPAGGFDGSDVPAKKEKKPSKFTYAHGKFKSDWHKEWRPENEEDAAEQEEIFPSRQHHKESKKTRRDVKEQMKMVDDAPSHIALRHSVHRRHHHALRRHAAPTVDYHEDQ